MYPGERSPLTPREAQHLVPRRLSGLGRDRTPGGGAEKSSCSGHVSYVQTGALQWVNIVVNVIIVIIMVTTVLQSCYYLGGYVGFSMLSNV